MHADDRSALLDPLTILRARDLLLIVPPGESGCSVILDQERGEYFAVPASGRAFLEHLTRSPLGLTMAEALLLHSSSDIEGLVELGLVHAIPPLGTRVTKRLILEFAVTNVTAQLQVAIWGWPAVASWMKEVSDDKSLHTIHRPYLFDEIEVAAQCAFAIPCTHRICTVVALTCAIMLRRRGFRARIEVMTDSDQVNPHAFASACGHRIDPSEEQVSGPSFKRLSSD
jgi:hypothetical protein